MQAPAAAAMISLAVDKVTEAPADDNKTV